MNTIEASMYDKLGRAVLLRLMTAEKKVLSKFADDLLERQRPADRQSGLPDEYTAAQIDRSWKDAIELAENDPQEMIVENDEIMDAVSEIVAVIAGGFFGRDAEKVKQFIEKGKENNGHA
jgi:hypothetical protein